MCREFNYRRLPSSVLYIPDIYIRGQNERDRSLDGPTSQEPIYACEDVRNPLQYVTVTAGRPTRTPASHDNLSILHVARKRVSEPHSGLEDRTSAVRTYHLELV